jgi:hypothetical protein
MLTGGEMIAGGARSKGQGGEREFCKILTEALRLPAPLSRNIDQTRIGGADIVELMPFAIEVKRQQVLHIPAWLDQAERQTTKRNPIPVLAYRQNGYKWTIMVKLGLVGKKRFKGISGNWCTINLETFVAIAKIIRG